MLRRGLSREMSSDEDDTWERPESAETVLEVGNGGGRALNRSEAIYPAGPGVRVAAGDSAYSLCVQLIIPYSHR